jgi:quaternary ammonium compound-resistance protein SugE
MTAWLALLFAGLMEIVWALAIKYSDGFSRVWPSLVTVVAIPLSFMFLSFSLKSVPFGTAYAVWVGIGAVGAALSGMVLFEEPAGMFRVACLLLIITGTIGLKLASAD